MLDDALLAAAEDMAREELHQEAILAAVKAAKLRIIARRNRPWWRLLFPFKITIKRI